MGWPELYDEMCAVAARGLFRGMDADDLAGFGIGFSLFDMPALSVLAGGIIAEEQAKRRPVAVAITAELPPLVIESDPEAVSEVIVGVVAESRPAETRTAAAEPAEADVTGHRLSQATFVEREQPSFDVVIRAAAIAV